MLSRSAAYIASLPSLPRRSTVSREARLILLLVLLMAAWLLAGRDWLDVGWGGALIPHGERACAYGLAFNDVDNLSYTAWAQQARLGQFPFRVLYSTEPHAALLVNPYFYLVGKAAALFAVHPIKIMNLAGCAAALLAIVFVYLACRAMAMTRRGAILAVLFVALGSGLSGVFWLLNLLFGLHLPLGRDLGPSGYFDLTPSLVFQFFPYHAWGLLLLAALLYFALAAERRRNRPLLLILAGCCAAALAATRPYEPFAFAVCYGLYALAGLLRGGRHSARAAARVRIAAVVLPAMTPSLLYQAWVSRQAVWAGFAAASLQHAGTRQDWLLRFGLFWPAAWLGWRFTRRRPANLDLAAVWAALLFLLLVVCNSAWSKLASGGFLALGILAGHACDRMLRWRRRLAGPSARQAAGLLVVLFILVSSLGTVVNCAVCRFCTPTVDRDVLRLAQVIRNQSPGRRFPLVLTDGWTGSQLPGLAGCQVYAGHWALTVRYDDKLRELNDAGLEWSPQAALRLGRPAPPRPSPQALTNLLHKAPFEFVLATRVCPAYALLGTLPELQPIQEEGGWGLFKVLIPSPK